MAPVSDQLYFPPVEECLKGEAVILFVILSFVCVDLITNHSTNVSLYSAAGN